MRHQVPGQRVPNPDRIAAPLTLDQCAYDRSAAYLISPSNWYWSQTIDAYLESIFKDPINDPAIAGAMCHYQVISSTFVFHILKEQKEAAASRDPAKIEESKARREAQLKALYDRARLGESLIIPINTGGHWVLSIMKRGQDGRVKLYYFDPLGRALPDQYRGLFEGSPTTNVMDIIQSNRRVQHEVPAVHCGPYVLETAEIFARSLVANDLDQAGLNAALGDMNRGEHVPDKMRLKHAQEIYKLARLDDSMNVSTSVIQQLGEK